GLTWRLSCPRKRAPSCRNALRRMNRIPALASLGRNDKIKNADPAKSATRPRLSCPRKRASSTLRPGDVRIEVFPGGIVSFNQRDFPRAIPFLQSLLPEDRRFDIAILFEID